MTLISSIFALTTVMLLLVYLLSLAEKKLLPQGDVKILINGDEKKSPKMKPGGTLLNALARKNIFVPSACGGGGTCSQCRCNETIGIWNTYIPSICCVC